MATATRIQAHGPVPKGGEGGRRTMPARGLPRESRREDAPPEDSNKKISTTAAAPKPDEGELVQSHLPLVKAIAWKFYTKNKDFVDLDDLIGAGSEGLVVAARHFDPTRGPRFATYASWWIRNRICRQIRDDRWVMQIPDRTYRKLLKLWKAAALLREEIGRDPSVEELAVSMGQTQWSVEALLRWSGQEVMSLDLPVGSSGTSTLADFIEDVVPSYYLMGRMDALDGSELRKAIRSVLQKLSPVERTVLIRRFGLPCEDEGNMTADAEGVSARRSSAESLPLKQIGDLLSLSDERIRQIECRAIRKLRHPKLSILLRPFARELF